MMQLYDYRDGYRFRMKCQHCGYHWHDRPADLLDRGDMHDRMHLDEVATQIQCRTCKRHAVSLMPIRVMKTHHFSGGLA